VIHLNQNTNSLKKMVMVKSMNFKNSHKT